MSKEHSDKTILAAGKLGQTFFDACKAQEIPMDLVTEVLISMCRYVAFNFVKEEFREAYIHDFIEELKVPAEEFEELKLNS